MAVATFLQPDCTALTGTLYKAAIDGNFAVLNGLAGDFAPMPCPTPNMTVALAPGVISLDGSLLVLGALGVTGTLAAGSNQIADLSSVVGIAPGMAAFQVPLYLAATVPSGNATVTGSPVVAGLTATAGLAVGMGVSGNGVPAGATVASVDSATQVTLSANATVTQSAVALAFTGTAIPAGTTVTAVGTSTVTLSTNCVAAVAVANLAFCPVSPVIAAPVTDPRLDLITLDRISGAVGVVAGAEAAAPTLPNLPSAKDVVGFVKLTPGMTAIRASAITDLRTAYRYTNPPVSANQLNFSMYGGF